MSKAVVTDERSKRVPQDATDTMVKAALDCNWEYEDETGLVHDIWHAMYAAAPLSHGAEAVEPEQKPLAWLCEDLIMPQNNSVTLDLEFAMSRAKYGDAWKVTPLYASPVRSAQEAASDLDIQIAYEAWIDRTIGARAPITAFYAGYRAALLPPGGETATPGDAVKAGELHDWGSGDLCQNCGTSFASYHRVDPCPGRHSPPEKQL